MMPSLRKKFAGFIRQLSVNNQAEVTNGENNAAGSGCFIQRYLNGDNMGGEEPTILHGRSPQELPRKALGRYSVGPDTVLAAVTGPEDGLRAVNKKQRHLSTSDPDVDYIDILDSQMTAEQERIAATGSSDCVFSRGHDRWFTVSQRQLPLPIDNSVMRIRAAGSVFDVGSVPPLDNPSANGNEAGEWRQDSSSDSELGSVDDVIPPPAEYATPECFALRKSKSAPAPFRKKPLSAAVAAGNRGKTGGETDRSEDAAGVRDWERPNDAAFGAATTLYERLPLTGQNAGNPIADCFAVVAREDGCVLALADGVNWGEKACLAARAAVHGCVEHLQHAVFGADVPRLTNTTEVLIALLRGFHAAHGLILREGGMLTTLTAAVVLPLADSDRSVACVCNVGDSLAYVYSPRRGSVREVTQGSHDIHCMRDMRDALGALGPVDGHNPELHNLTVALTEVEAGDVVFLTSDGVSDNFDPVVGKFCVVRPDDDEPVDRRTANINKSGNLLHLALSCPLPTVSAHQRHALSLLRMNDLLLHGVSGDAPPTVSARELVSLLLDFATRLTAAKRRILEDVELYFDGDGVELSRTEQRSRRRQALERLAQVPGKLDHATVVAYRVGFHRHSQL